MRLNALNVWLSGCERPDSAVEFPLGGGMVDGPMAGFPGAEVMHRMYNICTYMVKRIVHYMYISAAASESPTRYKPAIRLKVAADLCADRQ
jgi:hypothetical protein